MNKEEENCEIEKQTVATCITCGMETQPLHKCKCSERNYEDGSWNKSLDQTNNRIREEFKELRLMGGELAEGILKDGTFLSDWWLSKIAELLKSQEEEAEDRVKREIENEVEKLEVLWLTRDTDSGSFNLAGINKSQVLNIIKTITDK